MIAASILAIAALALLELLASSDAVGLTARRQALAAVEAERVLEICAQAVREGRALPANDAFQDGMQGEALEGCTITVTARNITEELELLGQGPAASSEVVDINFRLLVATVESPDGSIVIRLERAVPVESFN
jgi:hypothetical protein